MKKSIFLFFAAILCATSAWGADLQSGQYVYFEKPSDWTQVALLLGHSGYSIGYNMTTVANTNLYYWKTDPWGGYTQYAFIDAKDWGGQDWGDKEPNKRKTYAAHYSSTFYDSSTPIAKYHLFNTTKSIKSHASSYATAVNRTQTIKVQLKDGSNWVDATVVPADLTASTYALTSETAAGAKSAFLAKESTTVSATVSAAYSAKVTLTCTNILDGYVFEGWYDANGNKITSYTVSDAHTVYARFIQSAEETNEVNVTYMCGTTSVATAVNEFVGVESEKSFTAPTVTGYNFTGWTIGAGITLKAGTASDATITVVTKSASSDYTLVANYEEVLETVHFINAGKWSDVYLHLWNGNATGTAWPGSQLTATGEKIGEYDVYSHTAKQGDHLNLLFHENTGDVNKTADLTWTAGKYYIHNYNGNTGWYTQAEAEALLVAPIVYETVYFVNNKNWSLVQIHAWKDAANNGWPGQALTATGEQVAGFDVYSFEAAKGTYTNLLFNNKVGEEGVQSSNYVWTADKYYYMGAAENYAGGTKEEVAVLVTPDPLATNVYLAGDMTNKDNWDVNKKEFRKATADATNASVTVTLEAQTYKFKLVIDGAWKGNTGTMQRGGDAVHEGGWSFDKDGYDDNCQIIADIAGDYTFTWNLTDKKLTVAYPPLPKHQVTAIVNPAESGTVTGTGEYEQGSEATLVATPAAGYAFQNWTVAGTVKSVEATYKFAVTEAVELVANFVPEVTNEVTVSYLCNGTPIPGQTETKLAVGVTTPSTITAPTIKNYKFDSWTLGTGVQSEDATTANPIQITTLASGEYTLAANYTKIELTYTVEVPTGTEKCFIRGAFDGWDKFHEMELKDGETNIFTLTIDGAVTTNEYKYACQASWEYEEQKEDGGYVENRTWTALDRVEKWAKPVVVTYQLKGVGGWDQPGIELVQNPGNDKEYMLTCQAISATDAIKVVRLEDGVIKDYYGNGTVKDGVTVAVSYDGEANIKLPEGKYNFYFDTNASEKKLWIAAATDCGPATITLTTGDNSAVIAANIDKTVNVKIERSFTANDGYYTLCVPFNMDPSVIGKAYSLGTITEHVAGEGININLEEESELLAGVPYLVLPKANMSELVVENVTIQSDIASGQNVTGGEDLNVQIFFEGFYSAPAAPNNQTNGTTQYYVGEHGYLYNEVVDIRGLSGLFTITDKNGAPLNVRARVVTREDEATGFENITNGENTVIKVIENGQLVIIRNGEKFNAQGQKL